MATWHQIKGGRSALPLAPFVVVQDAPHFPTGYVCFDTREAAERCLAGIKANGGAYALSSYIHETRYPNDLIGNLVSIGWRVVGNHTLTKGHLNLNGLKGDLPCADAYRLRLFDDDGRLLWQITSDQESDIDTALQEGDRRDVL